MSDVLSFSLFVAVLLSVIATTMPLLLASLGELTGESAGVLNLGIEGIMLLGGLAGFATALATHSPVFGFIVAALVGVVASLPMVAAVMLGWNQIVVGLAVYLAGLGVTSVLHDAWFATNPRITPEFDWLPFLALLLALGLGLWLSRSAAGLRLRAAGLNPHAVDVAGFSVVRIRASTVLFGGALSGLAGAYLSIQVVGSFTPGMTHGIGFLAVIVVMLSRGRVWIATFITLVYGVLVTLGTTAQLVSLNLPTDVIEMVPFVLVMIALSLSRFGTTSSKILGNVYTRGATL